MYTNKNYNSHKVGPVSRYGKNKKQQLIFIKKKKSININSLMLIILISTGLFIFILINLINNYGTISGKIVDSNNQNIFLSNVTVSVDNQEISENNSETGTFNFRELKPGKHILSFKRENYNPIKQVIELKARKKLNLLIPMILSDKPKSPYYIAIANSGDNNISILESGQKKLISKINTGIKPYDIISISEKNKIYTTNLSDNSVSVIDGEKKKRNKKNKA
jgi:hypothetical protein